MSEIIGFDDTIALKKGKSVTIRAIIDSHDLDDGGKYVGPIAVCAFPFKNRQRLTVTEIGMERAHVNNDGLTSNVVYTFTVRHDGDKDLSFSPDLLCD